MHWITFSDANIPASFVKGEKYTDFRAEINQNYTTAPDFLSESDLITQMEKYNIGTDASMATHINNICEREYVTIQSKDRRLLPTKLGLALVHGFQKID